MTPAAIRRASAGALIALIALALPARAVADGGHSHGHADAAPAFSAGQPGDPKRPARIVLVTMRETADGKMLYEPGRLDVRQGEQVRFVLTNAGALAHEFVLASSDDNAKHAEAMRANAGMAHDEPNGRMLEPKAKAEIVWHFTRPGTFEFSCLIPGHRAAGITGIVTVRSRAARAARATRFRQRDAERCFGRWTGAAGMVVPPSSSMIGQCGRSPRLQSCASRRKVEIISCSCCAFASSSAAWSSASLRTSALLRLRSLHSRISSWICGTEKPSVRARRRNFRRLMSSGEYSRYPLARRSASGSRPIDS
jgi:uncharacterized cupredoxin-like copper-binding protein